MRYQWFKSLPALMIVGFALMLLPASAQTTGTTNLKIVVPTAGEITVTNSGNPVVLTQSGDTFTSPWQSAAGATSVNFSYRATKTSGSVALIVSATALTGSDGNVPPLSSVTAQATKGTIGSGTLNTTPIALGTSTTPSAANTIFSNNAGTHAVNQSFSVQYSMAAGDYAADAYTTTVTYTLTVL